MDIEYFKALFLLFLQNVYICFQHIHFFFSFGFHIFALGFNLLLL